MQDRLIGSGGGGGLAPLDLSYSGSHELYFDLYGGKPYMELMLTGSGTLLLPAGVSHRADIWGLGGGGGSDGSCGGGSGYTAMIQNALLTGTVEVVIGAGGTVASGGGSQGGATTVTGTNCAFSAAGGYPGKTKCGGNGGSGGGAMAKSGGVNGASGTANSSYTGGTGDGKLMARFYDPAKNHNYAKGASGTLFTGGSGYGDLGILVYKTLATTLLSGGGYGAGASQAVPISSNAATVCLAPTSGICFIRFPI